MNCHYEIATDGTHYIEERQGIAFIKWETVKLRDPDVKLLRIWHTTDPVLGGTDEYIDNCWTRISGPPHSTEDCVHKVQPETPRRPCNGLNIEIGTPSPRCLLKPPGGFQEGRSNLLYWQSGGSILAYGVCHRCPAEAYMTASKIH